MPVKRMRITIEADMHYLAAKFDRKRINAEILDRAKHAFPSMVYCDTEISADRHPIYCEGEDCGTNLAPRAAKKASSWTG